jgi:hypothetical protein
MPSSLDEGERAKRGTAVDLVREAPKEGEKAAVPLPSVKKKMKYVDTVIVKLFVVSFLLLLQWCNPTD